MNSISEDYNYLLQEGNSDLELKLEQLDYDKHKTDKKEVDYLDNKIENQNDESDMDNQNDESDMEYSEVDSDNQDINQNAGGKINVDIDYEKYEQIMNDNPLINKENVFKKVNKYVNLFNDENYQNYKDGYLTKKLYSKLNKKHKLVRKKNHLYIKKINDESNKYLIKLKLPKYLFIKDYENELNSKLINKKIELDKIFNKLRKEQKRSQSEIKYFKECKKDYIELLEEIEFVKLYYIIVNKLSVENIKKISYSIQDYNMEKNINLYEKKHFIFDQQDIDEINEKKIVKLNNYNELLNNIKTEKNDKIIKDEIVDFIKKYDTINENINNDLKVILKKVKNESIKQQFLVDYIVLELPQLN